MIPEPTAEDLERCTITAFSPLHPHEPEIPSAFDVDGRCLVCCLLVRVKDAERERDEIRVREATLGHEKANRELLLASLTEALYEIAHECREPTTAAAIGKARGVASAALKRSDTTPITARDRHISALEKERDELRAEVERLKMAFDEARDTILNQRHECEEPCLDSDQANSVLAVLDRCRGLCK